MLSSSAPSHRVCGLLTYENQSQDSTVANPIREWDFWSVCPWSVASGRPFGIRGSIKMMWSNIKVSTVHCVNDNTLVPHTRQGTSERLSSILSSLFEELLRLFNDRHSSFRAPACAHTLGWEWALVCKGYWNLLCHMITGWLTAKFTSPREPKSASSKVIIFVSHDLAFAGFFNYIRLNRS